MTPNKQHFDCGTPIFKCPIIKNENKPTKQNKATAIATATAAETATA